MSIILAIMLAAAGLLIGWAAGSALAARVTRRRREHESMKNYRNLCRVLTYTARTNLGDK